MENRADIARQTVLRILHRCVARIDSLELKGKKADEAALHFLAGAVAAFEGDDLVYNWIGNIMVYSVSVRGMMGVREEIANISGRRGRTAA
jgi:hypothetical protein